MFPDWLTKLDAGEVIALVSAITAFVSLLLTILFSLRTRQLQIQANNIARQQVAASLRDLVDRAHLNSQEAGQRITEHLQGKTKSNMTASEKRHLERLTQARESAVASLLNAYNDACAAYLDGTIDPAQFKRIYYEDVRNLCHEGDGAVHKLLHPPRISRYGFIWKVYERWRSDA